MSDINTFVNTIFNSNQAKFNHMYRSYLHLINQNLNPRPHTYDYLEIDETNLISILTMGLFACLKTFSENPIQKEFATKYVTNVMNFLRGPRYDVYEPEIGIVKQVKSIFLAKSSTLKQTCMLYIPVIINKIYDSSTNKCSEDYVLMQKLIDEFFNRELIFHNGEYVNMITTCFYNFIVTLNTYEIPNKKTVIFDYFEELLKFCLTDWDNCIYSEPNNYDCELSY